MSYGYYGLTLGAPPYRSASLLYTTLPGASYFPYPALGTSSGLLFGPSLPRRLYAPTYPLLLQQRSGATTGAKMDVLGAAAAAAAAADKQRKQRKRRRDGSPPLRTLKQYTVDEKLDIINFAAQMGNRAAGREYNVAESSIREWRKNEAKLRGMMEMDPDRGSRLVGGHGRGKAGGERSEDRDDEIKLSQVEVVHVPLLHDDLDNSRSLSIEPRMTTSPGHVDSDRADSSPRLMVETPPLESVVTVTPTAVVESTSHRRKSRHPKKLVAVDVISV